jgi:hypothetical protein
MKSGILPHCIKNLVKQDISRNMWMRVMTLNVMEEVFTVRSHLQNIDETRPVRMKKQY